MKRFTREELLSLARRRPKTLVDMFLDLQGRLACNSTNSDQPPAADGLAKPAPKSLREKTGRKPGGQPGHPGATLALVENADHVQTHQTQLCTCGFCQRVSLADQPVLAYERRQGFDLPPLRLEVTEHRAEIKICPVSSLKVKAAFPAGVEAPVQYGPNFRGLTLYLFNQQLLPFDRLRQTCLDLFGQPLSLIAWAKSNAQPENWGKPPGEPIFWLCGLAGTSRCHSNRRRWRGRKSNRRRVD